VNQVTDLPVTLRTALDEWLRLQWSDLHFEEAGTSFLVLLAVAAIAGLALLARGLRSRQLGRAQVVLPSLVARKSGSSFTFVRHGAFLVFLAGVPFFAVALADPHTTFTREETSYPGRRIALLVDGSGSMVMKFDTTKLRTAENRAYYTAVAAAEHFMRIRLNGRYRDLIALIQYGNEAYVVTPFTTDYENVLLSIRLISAPKEWGRFNDFGTTILQGLDNAVALFRAFDFASAAGNLMVMFTDGRDDERTLKGRGIDQIVADMRRYRIPVYMVRVAFNLKEGQIVTDKLWKPIVEGTGGRFYAADNEEAILKAEAEIDKLSAGRIDVREYTAERPRFAGYLLIAVALWLIGAAMQVGVGAFRTYP
jgi:Ca-activated chloride channel family protein